jgi:quercetin dioxygenase-like cupin family protein
MAIRKISSKGTEACPTGEVLLAAGEKMAMRLWQSEEPQNKDPHQSPYETLGYVIAGRAELTIEGESVDLVPGDSWLVPADTMHRYRIIETFTAVEATSPPAIFASK